MHAQVLSHVQLCAIPGTVACQAPLSMEFSRQENWSELPCPPPGGLSDPGSFSDPGINPPCPESLAFSFLNSPTLTSIHDHWKNHSLD